MKHPLKQPKNFLIFLKKCVDTGGEIGLHTHFNSLLFKSSQLTMPEDPNVWEKAGIIEPKQRLEEFLKKHNTKTKQKKVIAFKAGNHIRNMAMFEKIVEHGFEIDTTCSAKHIEIREKNAEYFILFDDINITCEPFEFQTKNGVLFEIPELGAIKPSVIQSIFEKCKNEELFLRIQLHPWQAIEEDIQINRNNTNDNRSITLLDVINNCLQYIYSTNIPIEYMNCENMRDIYSNNYCVEKKCINTDVNITSRYKYNDFIQLMTHQEITSDRRNKIADYFFKKSQHNNESSNFNTTNKSQTAILKTFEKKISSKYNQLFLNDRSTHYKTMLKNNRIFGTLDLFIIDYINKHFGKNISCCDIFAGIGQSAMGLYLLGFKHVGILEYDNYRVNLANTICNNEKLQVKIIGDNFFNNNDIYNFDLIFSNNAVATILNYNIDKQIMIYNKFLSSSNKKDIIMNAEKYGADEKGNSNVVFYNIINSLKKHNIYVYNLPNNFYRISNYACDNIDTMVFSENFTSFNLINDKNIEINIIPDNRNVMFKELKSIAITLGEKEKHGSFGLFFPIKNNTSNKHKLSFYARSEKICKLKVYTGLKWIKINKDVLSNYELFEVEAEFDFNSRSSYRIGIQDINNINDNTIFIINPNII